LSDQIRAFRFGLDIGQKRDHSALCLVEERGPKLVVKLLVKYPLMTPFPVIFKTVQQAYSNVARVGQIVSFAVDATGTGQSPAQMLQQLIPEGRIEAFVFNNKNKREMVGKLKVLHSYGRLKFARRMGDATYNTTLLELVNELRNLQAKIIREDPSNPEIEVFRTGSHDDLVSALCLALKDIEIREDYVDSLFVIPDRTWQRTPLDSTPYPEPVTNFGW
jgi:phage FluMu gp28-like protein